ncbi:peptidase inhibitor family I36 [Haloactinopolyspora alba]|uniref:Peptidase inhibitor family I36 n=1 Tax=Haloactinopolyspora alba TaxID=648780 RepID=A0A2P8DXA4_9ACTN|nr:peptidase inhibitor family I36 protein [Haloactinopolyspora alba]PSL01845.1 peptidase inhibitor family I36 [Haloactinopolyspora alba]
MPHPPRSRLLTTLLAVAAVTMTTATAAHATPGDEPSAGTPSGPLAAEMSRALELRPGGVQVSDNAMAWDGGDVVLVWPDPGAEAAPAGLGANVRTDLVERMDLDDALAQSAPAQSAPSDAAPSDGAAADGVSTMGDWRTCSPGYYCFYTGTYYNGSRLQFRTRCSGGAGAWGFSNVTSSWVNRNYNMIVRAYDYKGGRWLWTMRPGAMDTYVGSSDNNEMSYFRCQYV